MSTSEFLKKRALQIGFDLAGVAPITAWQDLEFSRKWVEQGFGGEMKYLENPKRHDPRRLLPSVKSVICVGLIYNTDYLYSTELGGKESRSQESEARGENQDHLTPAPSERSSDFDPPISHAVEAGAWMSRYAWGRDYHEVMRPMLKELRTAIEAEAPGVETRAYVDTGPIVERAFARYSGLGWMGKNTCLINEQRGSWFFLGVVLCSLALEPDLPAPDRCGSCTRCLEACPTGALVEPYVMDATRCISYFTIERKGSIPEEFRPAIGANIFGCDICQDVCPWNSCQSPIASVESQRSYQPSGASPQARIIGTTSRPEFQPMRVTLEKASPENSGLQRELPTDDGQRTRDFCLFNPSLDSLAALTEDDFRRIFRQSPVKRAKYRGWLRNLSVVMGNSRDRKFIPWLERIAQGADAMLCEHAEWALKRLRSEEKPWVKGD